MKDFLLTQIVKGKYFTYADLFYYFLIPLFIFALFYLVINGKLIKRKVDTGIIVISVIVIIVLQYFIKDPLNNFLVIESSVVRPGLAIGGVGPIPKIDIIPSATITKSTTYNFTIIAAAAFDIIMGIASIIFHNFYVDERTTAFSQGMRAFIASMLVAIGISCLGIFATAEDFDNISKEVNKIVKEDLNVGKTKTEVTYGDKAQSLKEKYSNK
jgi:hypothetical protein